MSGPPDMHQRDTKKGTHARRTHEAAAAAVPSQRPCTYTTYTTRSEVSPLIAARTPSAWAGAPESSEVALRATVRCGVGVMAPAAAH